MQWRGFIRTEYSSMNECYLFCLHFCLLYFSFSYLFTFLFSVHTLILWLQLLIHTVGVMAMRTSELVTNLLDMVADARGGVHKL